MVECEEDTWEGGGVHGTAWEEVAEGMLSRLTSPVFG